MRGSASCPQNWEVSVSEADPHLSEIRRAALDAGQDLVWEIRLPPLPEAEGWNLLEDS